MLFNWPVYSKREHFLWDYGLMFFPYMSAMRETLGQCQITVYIIGDFWKKRKWEIRAGWINTDTEVHAVSSVSSYKQTQITWAFLARFCS